MEAVEKRTPGVARWALQEICRIAADHNPPQPHIHEMDILRASGPLKLLGIEIGAYVGRGHDCIAKVQFLSYPEYEIPVEIKKKSRGFRYQESRYPERELSRVIVLCALHNYPGIPSHIDVIELNTLCDHLGKLPLFADISAR
jgi:hypothetical protein